MDTPKVRPFVDGPGLIQQVVELLGSGVMIEVATRDALRIPEVVVGHAVRFAPEEGVVELVLPTLLAGRTLANARSNQEMAVVFCRPTDDRAVQLKGTFLGERPADAEALALRERWRNAATESLAYVGVPRSQGSRLGQGPAVVVAMKLRDIFETTPGPNAGTRLTR